MQAKSCNCTGGPNCCMKRALIHPYPFTTADPRVYAFPEVKPQQQSDHIKIALHIRDGFGKHVEATRPSDV